MKNNNDEWIDSGARWISKADSQTTSNLYLEFARRFDYHGGLPLTIDITAVSQYQLAINGQIVGRGPAVSNQTLYYFDRYVLDSADLQPGTNLITVLLFHDGCLTDTEQKFEYGEPGLLLKVYTDELLCVSDPSWRVRQSLVYSPLASMVSHWGGYKTYYHAEREDDWQTLAFDHATWEAAVEVAEAVSSGFVSNLILLDIPFLETVLIDPLQIIDLSANGGQIDALDATLPVPYRAGITFKAGLPFATPSITLDFGCMVVGYPEITVKGGCIYEVWYGETLDLLRLDVVRAPQGGTCQLFQRRSFRFIKINFIALDGAVTLDRIVQHQTWYAYHEEGGVASSDDRLNTIIDISKVTVRINSSYHYEDCPMREQALWIFDMRSMSLVNYYHYYNPELTAKCLRQMFALQREDGSIVSLGPKQAGLLMLDFCLHLVATLTEYYQHTGDVGLVQELYPYVRKLHTFITQFRDDDGLLDSDKLPEVAVFLDWSATIQKRGKTLILNALYKRYLEDVALLANLVEEPESGAALLTEATGLKDKLHQTFFWAEKGLYRDAWRFGEPLNGISQQANIAALYADIVPHDQISSVLDKAWNDYPQPFAPAYYLTIFEALARIGRTDLIHDSIKTYWGAMLDRGATTWWEVFDPTTPAWSYPHPFLGNTPTFEMDWIPISTCHGWSSIPAYAVVRYLLGVDLSQLHRNTIIIRPGQPYAMGNVRFSLPLPGGQLDLAYELDGDRWRVEIRHQPEGITIICE